MKKTITMPITKKWFDMILSGEKKEEYRKIKEYWRVRLTTYDVTHLELVNGYGKKRPSIKVEVESINIGKGKEEWGATPERDYYVIKLGKIIERRNLCMKN